MKRSGAFAIGALSGALAVLIALKLREQFGDENPYELADKVAGQLEELEQKALVSTEAIPRLHVAK